MGTIPIFWGEADGMAATLAGNGIGHWARPQLERQFALKPLDVLDEASLAPLDYLLLAQPRPLTPEENVALDSWVRNGGRLLLFADPFLTGESQFALGDRRRPQDVILLSPILGRWGLELRFDEDQPAGPQMRDFAGTPLPTNLAGTFALRDGEASCVLQSHNAVATCEIGDGAALLVADAAVLDLHEPDASASQALAKLIGSTFGTAKDQARGPDG